jgi:formamidopyrimidine-DNA glycosylase
VPRGHAYDNYRILIDSSGQCCKSAGANCKLISMPELPDIAAYISALEPRIVAQPIERVRLASPFLLRTAQPPLTTVETRTVRELRRIGKRIAIGVDGELWLVLHLMIAGRQHWRPAGTKLSGRQNLAAFDFPSGSLVLTEGGSKHRASLHVLAGEQGLRSVDPGGIEVFTSDCNSFRAALTAENRTLKRALTDPRLVSGIGNAYSDEILHAAQLSPIAFTHKLEAHEWERPAARGGGSRFSRKSNRISQRYGGSWTLWRTLFEVWRKDSANSLRGQRNELLRSMPNRWESSCGSRFVPAVAIGLATNARRPRSPEIGRLTNSAA